MVKKGALIGYESEVNLNRMPRRIALNILKILEGENAANLTVTMNSYSESTILNMATARRLRNLSGLGFNERIRINRSQYTTNGPEA